LQSHPRNIGTSNVVVGLVVTKPHRIRRAVVSTNGREGRLLFAIRIDREMAPDGIDRSSQADRKRS